MSEDVNKELVERITALAAERTRYAGGRLVAKDTDVFAAYGGGVEYHIADLFPKGSGVAVGEAYANAALMVELVNNLPEITAALRSYQSLKEALEPFAREADAWDDPLEPLSDEYVPLIGHEQDTLRCKAKFSLGDLRRARQALNTGDKNG